MGLLSSALGSLGGALWSNREKKKQAQKQMDFQMKMSSTAHQREVADLRKAGLNPILSGLGGSGASAPQGAMAPLENVSSSAVSMNRQKAETLNIEASTAQTQATTALTREALPEAQANAKLYQELSNAGLDSTAKALEKGAGTGVLKTINLFKNSGKSLLRPSTFGWNKPPPKWKNRKLNKISNQKWKNKSWKK